MESKGNGKGVNIPLVAVLLLGMAACSGTIDLGAAPASKTPPKTTNLASVYSAVDTLWGRYVTAERGLVDYDAIYDDPLLQDAHDAIAGFDMSTIGTGSDSLAFWINAYNLMVVYYLREYDFKKQSDIGFPLFSRKIEVGGEELTLDQLEKKTDNHIKKFHDPRTHFALVCAALSCPPLMNRAYRGDKLYQQLDTRTKQFINSPAFTILDATPVKVSQLFQWYATDFQGFVRDTSQADRLGHKQGGTVQDFIASYVVDPARAEGIRQARLSYLTYDWTINAKQ